MEKHPDPFDDIIKEAMKGHRITPREKARQAFLDEASTILPARRTWKYWYFLPVLVIFIAAVVALLVYDDSPEQEAVGGQQQAVGGQHPEIGSWQLAVGKANDSINNNLEPGTRNSESVTRNLEPETRNPEPVTRNAEPVGGQQSAVSSQQPEIGSWQLAVGKANDSTSNNPEPETLNPEPVAQNLESDTQNLEPGIWNLEPDTVNPEPGTRNPEPETRNPEAAWRLAISTAYTPEVMFNTLEGDKFVHNAGIDVIFYHGLVSIRTGAGVSVSKGITKNSVAYNDYLGTYNKLDSVTFTFNEAIHNFETNVYTSSQKVWDTLEQSDSADIVKRYSYFQVPLVLGFDFWQKGRISIGVRIGTIMSVMMKAKQLTGEYDPGENLVKGINQLTPSQVNLNWQALGGFAASATITDNFTLEFEPQARYYYGSIYEKSGNVKKPWSIGIRLAAVYKF